MSTSSVSMPKIGVVLLVPDRWRGIWTLRHHIALRLGRHFEVVWVNAARPWREHWGLAPASDIVVADNAPAGFPGLTIYDPGPLLAKFHKPRWLRDGIQRAWMRAALRILRTKGCTRIIAYLWRPEFAWALDALPADVTSYHIDDEYSFATTEQPPDPAEIDVIRRVDQVFIHSPKLLRRKGSLNPNTSHIPNGVDYAAYSTPVAEPADLAAIPRPRIGYVGVVKAQLDLQLLLELARRTPAHSFVLVGPWGFMGEKAALLDELRSRPNVHLLGNRPVHTLPAYVQWMNVCTMPYEVNAYTNCIYPLKLHEYLAAGRPVVSSPIETLEPFRDVVSLASTVDGWQEAIEAALRPSASAPGAIEARRARAAENDWDVLVERIAGHLRSRLP